MSTTSLVPLARSEIEDRVRAGLMDAVYKKLYFLHRKRGFSSDCDCTYCELKRQASRECFWAMGNWNRSIVRQRFRERLRAAEI